MNETILLAEDDENDAFFLKRAMTRAGMPNSIQHVWDGREALDYFQGNAKFGDRNQFPLPGLVLLDLKLPFVMGLEVLKWIRDQGHLKSVKVFVLTSSPYPDDITEAYRYGADAFFVKPGSLQQLDVVARTIRDSWFDTNHSSPPHAELAREFSASSSRPPGI